MKKMQMFVCLFGFFFFLPKMSWLRFAASNSINADIYNNSWNHNPIVVSDIETVRQEFQHETVVMSTNGMTNGEEHNGIGLGTSRPTPFRFRLARRFSRPLLTGPS